MVQRGFILYILPFTLHKQLLNLMDVSLKYMIWNSIFDWAYENLPFNNLLNATVVGESGTSIKKLVPSSQLRARRGSNGKHPKNGTLSSAAILLAPPVFAGNMAVSVYKAEQETKHVWGEVKNKFTMHMYVQIIYWIFNIFNTSLYSFGATFLNSLCGDWHIYLTVG